MWKITNISNSFFFEDWNISGYFEMLEDRFLHLRGVFLREYGAAGDWFFWGLIFFLALILGIYIKLLTDMLKKSEQVLNEEIEENDETDEFESVAELEEDADNQFEEVLISEQKEATSDNESAEQTEFTEQNLPPENIADEFEEDKEEMEKKLSVDIVQKSKISDDYLNLKEVLYKQSKSNNEAQENSQKPEDKTKTLSQDSVWDLQQSVGIIINMLAHNVSDKKIAQSIYYLNKGADDAEEIIQLIKAVKSFIGYCNTAKFAELPNREKLPSCEDALYMLALGNNKLCMELMEVLLNTQVTLAQRQRGLSKELSYSLAADYACTMGTLANLNNYELAINSFELALDLAPKNVSALSRAADLYWQDNNSAKAAETYQQVLSLADDVIYPEQKANANLKLAQYYRTAGKMFKADEMERDGRKFFENYGIKNPLSDAEKNTLSTLLEEQNEKMSEYIKKLL